MEWPLIKYYPFWMCTSDGWWNDSKSFIFISGMVIGLLSFYFNKINCDVLIMSEFYPLNNHIWVEKQLHKKFLYYIFTKAKMLNILKKKQWSVFLKYLRNRYWAADDRILLHLYETYCIVKYRLIFVSLSKIVHILLSLAIPENLTRL